MMGFMGLGMAQQAGGSNVQNLFAMGQQSINHFSPKVGPAPVVQ